MAYVYRHIRLDKNTPFYIGIGSDEAGYYKRAFSKSNRNSYWHNVINKTPYEIEILFDSMSWEDACKKEIEFINLYGRIDMGNGVLVNMSNGGEGVSGWSVESKEKQKKSMVGFKVTEETRRKLSESHKGYRHSQESLEKIRASSRSRPITKETREKMAATLRGRAQPKWQRDILSKAAMGKKVIWCYKPILQYDIYGNFIKEHESISSACRELGLQSSNIDKVLKKNRNHTGNFIFKYKKT